MNDHKTKNYSCSGRGEISRRSFLKYSAGTFGGLSLSALTAGCGGGGGGGAEVTGYPIDSSAVATTRQRMLSFPKMPPAAVAAPLKPSQLSQFANYGSKGYGEWTFGSPLRGPQRMEIMGDGYANPSPTRTAQLVNFFAFTDIHITDKEAPNQLIYLQQLDRNSYNNSSICSPVMMYTTHVLDAAIQTANALHKQTPFDFGISLGDTCNNTSYNELRWYIDVIDGKVITPSSGNHVGADTVDYQKPFKAAGLDKSIPWYQVLGNHDHFFIGSFPVDADPSLGLRKSYFADTVWNIGDVLDMSNYTSVFPVLFDMERMKSMPSYYMGVFDCSTPVAGIVKMGATDSFPNGAPKVVADPNRRSLLRTEWIQEFYNTSTNPVGHGFNLVDKSNPAWDANGFACYSFVPNTRIPLKVIVLDNTQSESDGSTDIHGHGYLDANRWAWLKAELASGQAANQLMIIAAHIPIGVSAVGSETEWWAETANIAPEHQNAVSLTELVTTLQDSPNLLMWIAGHRHLNVVKAFKSMDASKPEKGFWQVETSSLRDFPQQFRTFQIYLNSDYTVSIVTTNVDPAVAAGTPAAASRKFAIGVQQILNNNLNLNNPNVASAIVGVDGSGNPVVKSVPTMDPTRTQAGYINPLNQALLGGAALDPTIRFEDMSTADYPSPVPVHGSCNGELFKQLTPQMVSVLKAMFPTT